jgi:deazaflavin-dependent oxidoreductase (nitroreductase family)
MTNVYRLGPLRRGVNVLIKALTRIGLGGPRTYVLTVRGRKTGERHSTPVNVMEIDRRRYLVAPYGPVGWVKNARAAGEVTLTRKGRAERFTVRELGPEDSVPVLRLYLEKTPVVRSFFDVKPESSDEEFAGIAPQKPVFELTSAA